MHRFNTKRKFGENACYIYARIEGRELLFTESQVAHARKRASENQEDLPDLTLLHRLAYWLLEL